MGVGLGVLLESEKHVMSNDYYLRTALWCVERKSCLDWLCSAIDLFECFGTIVPGALSYPVGILKCDCRQRCWA